MKRINSIISIILIITLLTHIFTTTLFLITGFRIELLNNIFARASYGLILFHILISIIILLKNHDAKPLPIRYMEYTYRIHIQRFSGLLMLLLLHSHISQMVIVLRNLPLDGNGKIIFCLINIAFFATIFLHIAASFTRAFISLGIMVNTDTIKKSDRLTFLFCAVCFVVTTICTVYFVLSY